MLLRSASSPLLGHAACASAAEHVGAVVVVVPVSPAAARQRGPPLCRATSEGDLMAAVSARPRALSVASSASISVEEEVEEEEEEEEDVLGAAVPLRRLLTSTGLDADTGRGREGDAAVVEEGVGGGGGGRKVCNGGGGGSGGKGDGGRRDADAHYRRMIQADPANPLLLGNYARFLKEVEGDAARAQEYCERAIVANPGDGDALALYAGLVWETTRDADRADAYFTRAVHAAPDDW
ncbi:Os06g0606700 [Oryza sativa Japonica Group]|uniref:Os06g0606700 protein n=1 Tax=Oryza sativa subsp. japonica TaxID=39947 RepID=Q0DB34_ORYSJ|nr:Os06g0606700 [Oryza sativa Japonica Group]|eukprot:NP_001058025.2 Os06g0606700 [Oryza sativa Japonica Group]